MIPSGAVPEDENPRVFLIDDDPSSRDALVFLLGSIDLRVEVFASPQDFLASYEPPLAPSCILADVRMPGMSGLDLQEKLRRLDVHLPMIIMSGYADVPMVVRAMRQGALDFLEKPCNGQKLLDCVQRAIDYDSERRRERLELQALEARLARLTPREKEVMKLVVHGSLNKQIASTLHISLKTVEQHRARVMRKMEADSLAQLVSMAFALGLASPHSTRSTRIGSTRIARRAGM